MSVPVCRRMCSSRELLSLQAFSHTVHMKFDTYNKSNMGDCLTRSSGLRTLNNKGNQ